MMGVYEDLEESGIQERMKKRRLCENQNEVIYENEDRLSDLPDCVILHILSFLNTKHVVQTCALSTRWKHLWKRIPTLILHSSRFSTVKIFASFVSNILTLRDNSTALHALDLVRGSIEPQLLKKILNYVYSHNTHLRELGILVSGDSSRILNCVSSCQALTSLKLSLYSRGSCNFTKTLFPKSLNLPLLTTLDLTNFAFEAGETGCADPFLAFTKLNSLVIYSCKVKDTSTLRISSETLVNLAIDSHLKKISLVEQHNLSDVVIVELSTPNLCTFKFTTCDLVQKICGSGLSSVKQVNIDSNNHSASLGDALVLRSWLQNFANVESLTVTSTVLQILSLLPDLLEIKLPSLCYLKSLEVKLVPLLCGLLLLKLKDAMIKKAAAKSRKEVAKLRKTFKAHWKPPAIPDGIVDFLRQNSPSAEVKITTEYSWSHFNIKQIEESIKGVKIIKYPSRLAAPASSAAYASTSESASNASPASATAAPAPTNLHIYGTEKVEESIKGAKIIKYHSKFVAPAFSSASPASAAVSTCALAAAPPSALPASAAESACALAAAPSSALPASAAESACALAAAPPSASPPNLHPCRAKQMVTNIDNSDPTLWPDSVTKAFIEIMVDEVTKGNMSNGMFHTRTWTSMTTLLNSITNSSYETEQLKEKMHSLRAMFHEFYSLLQNTGFNWNVETNTVIASEDDWQNYLKTHDRASQFLNKGCDHYKLLEMIFNKNNEAEVLHASTQDRPNTDKESEFDNQKINTGTGSANDNSYNVIEEVECIKCRGKQRSQVKDHTSRKESASGQKENALACGKNVEITSSHVTIDYSLTKCVVALEEIKDISDETFGKALEKFKDPDWREMFMAMSNDRKRGWLFRL